MGTAYEHLRATVPETPVVYTDDTGRRVGGESVAELLHRARLIPGQGARDRAAGLARESDVRVCDRPALDRSEMLRGALGPAVVDHYVHTARWEQFEYDRRITDWELKRGFERA